MTLLEHERADEVPGVSARAATRPADAEPDAPDVCRGAASIERGRIDERQMCPTRRAVTPDSASSALSSA